MLFSINNLTEYMGLNSHFTSDHFVPRIRRFATDVTLALGCVVAAAGPFFPVACALSGSKDAASGETAVCLPMICGFG